MAESAGNGPLMLLEGRAVQIAGHSAAVTPEACGALAVRWSRP